MRTIRLLPAMAGVAIAISLVPPLAVVGVCLGEGAVLMALGALLLFVSNLVSMVIAGTVLFAALGYASEAEQQARRVGAERKSFLTLGILLALVLVPLAANTALVVVLHGLSTRIESVAETWLAGSPQAEVTDVEYTASAFRVDVRTPPGHLPPTQQLLGALLAPHDGGGPRGRGTAYADRVRRWV